MRDELVATEDALRAAAGEVGRGDGFTWFRSDEFPGWFMGGGIRPDDPAARSLAGWERVHDGIVAPSGARHRLIEFRLDDTARPLMEEARAAGYAVYDCHWMVLRDLDLSTPTPAGCRLAEVVDAEGAERLRVFDFEEYARDTEAPNWSEKTFEQYTRATRACTERTPVRWFEATREIEGEVVTVARTGVFGVGRVARLQSVGTHPDHQRQGLGRALMAVAARVARDELGCQALAASAQVGQDGHKLYTACGFEECGREAYLLKRPDPSWEPTP